MPLLLLLKLVLTVHMTRGCMRMAAPLVGGGGGGGGAAVPVTLTAAATTSTTTISTTTTCGATNGMMGAKLFLSSSVPTMSTTYGMVAPLASNCMNCSAGSENVYPDSGSPNLVASDQKAIGSFTCTNMCICATDGKCYMIKTPETSAVFYPYCSNGACVTYVIINGAADTDGYVASDGSMFTVGQQFQDSTTTTRFPVTQQNAYMQAQSTGCNGCPVQMC